MYNIKPFLDYNLLEAGQPNPIRWTIVQVDGDTLTPLAPTMKCKDYFNDVVAAKNGVFFTKYGFNNKVVPVKEGLDILLTGLHNVESFKQYVNKITQVDNPVTMVDCVADDEEAILLHIPEYYFKNTYRISLLTYAIRLCNEKTGLSKVTDIHSLLKTNIAIKSTGLNAYGRQLADKYEWDVPFGDIQWWRTGNTYNSVNAPKDMFGLDTTVHNCGVNAWANSGIIETEGVM